MPPRSRDTAPWRVACCLVVASLCARRVARADPPVAPITSSLNWTRLPGAEACIAPGDLARSVEARLGRTVFVSSSQAGLVIEGRIEPARRGFRATLTATRSDGTVVGQRELLGEQPACRELDPSLVLVIALMIDPDAHEHPAPAPTPHVNVRRERVVVVTVQTQPPPWTVGLELSGAALLGELPGLAAGARVAVALRASASRWAVELSALVSAPQEVASDSHAATLLLAYGRFAVCPTLLSAGRLRVAACAGVEAGAIDPVATRGVTASRPSAAPYVAPALEGRIAVRVAGPVYAQLGVGVAFPVIRPEFAYTELDANQLALVPHNLFELGPVVGLTTLGLAWQIP